MDQFSCDPKKIQAQTHGISHSYCDMKLLDPAILAAARAQGLTVTVAKERAAEFGMTLRACLGLEDAPISELAFKYMPNGPLVEPAQKESLPTQMHNLLR
jgi:hypothetical protein